VASYRRALERDPQSVEALVNLGRVLIQLDDLDEGEALFRAALEIAPDQEGAVAGLADVARYRGEHEQATEGHAM
jgi:cytochrome c-type biogenesis protein CcmH/NrfG